VWSQPEKGKHAERIASARVDDRIHSSKRGFFPRKEGGKSMLDQQPAFFCNTAMKDA